MSDCTSHLITLHVLGSMSRSGSRTHDFTLSHLLLVIPLIPLLSLLSDLVSDAAVVVMLSIDYAISDTAPPIKLVP